MVQRPFAAHVNIVIQNSKKSNQVKIEFAVFYICLNFVDIKIKIQVTLESSQNYIFSPYFGI